MEWGWGVTLLAIIGAILNIYKNKICFLLWGITDVAWIYLNIQKEIYSQATLFFVYLLLAFYGYWEWNKKEKLKIEF